MPQNLVITARFFLGIGLVTILGSEPTMANMYWCPRTDRSWNSTEIAIYESACVQGSISGRLDLVGGNREVQASFIRNLLIAPRFREIREEGALTFSQLFIEGPLKLQDAQISSDILISNSSFLSSVDVSGASIDGNLSLLNTNVNGELDLEGLRLNGSLYLGDKPDITPDPTKPRGGTNIKSVDGEGAKILGNVAIEGANIPNGLEFSYASIAGYFEMARSITPRIDLVSGDFGKQFVLVDDDLRGPHHTPNSNVLNAEFESFFSIDMYLAYFNQTVFLDRSVTNNPINAGDALINGSLSIIGTHLSSLVAPGVRINGELLMGFNDKAILPFKPGGKEPALVREDQGPMTTFAPGSTLDIRYATINAIAAPEQLSVWPSKLYLTNFHLNSFTPENCTSNIEFPVELNASCADDLAFFKRWLSLDPDSEHIMQSYQMIEDLLASRGDKDEADQIGFARGDHKLRSHFNFPYISFLYQLVYRETVGYGYYPEWSVWWILFLTILGALIYRRTDQAQQRGNKIGLTFSFDLLLPLIRLDEENYKVKFFGPTKYYFYFHRLAGWILGSFLVSAISLFGNSR